MEPIGSILEDEWSSLSGMYTGEEADLMAQLLGNCAHPTQVHYVSTLGLSSSFWPSNEAPMNLAGANQGSFYSLDIANSNSYRFSQEGDGSGIIFPDSSQESYFLSDSHPISLGNNNSNSMDYYIGNGTNTVSHLVEGDECSNQEGRKANVEKSGRKVHGASPPDNSLDLQLKREAETPAPESPEEEKSHNPSEKSRKRSRNSEDAPKEKQSVRPKRSKKLVQPANNNEESNAGLNAPASSSYCSEDDSNASQELDGGASSSLSSKETSALNSSGKTRASRGAATDPQSLYARKRRERINERLRILQNLVPNGTKVDISTMLEEAVEYVKFLQLQIKLLSSDELWMYAPIAYNGMNLGLDLKVPTPR